MLIFLTGDKKISRRSRVEVIDRDVPLVLYRICDSIGDIPRKAELKITEITGKKFEMPYIVI